MRPTALLLIAAASAFAARPRYGGTLTIEMRGAPQALDPTAADTLDAQRISMAIFDRLVETAERPGLASTWSATPDKRQWRFALRPGVRLHDGSALTAAQAAAGLAPALRGRTVTSAADSITIAGPRPMPALVHELAHPRASVVVRQANGTLLGTGPFRVTVWESGQRIRLAAFDGYWGGRPYLDTVDIRLGRPLRDQLAAVESGQADIGEVSPADSRRQEQRGRVSWSGAPLDLIALVFLNARPPAQDARVRSAFALAVDRGPMWTVLLQRKGETSGSLLPGSMTGWGFVFPAQRDLARARPQGAPPAVTLGVDSTDALLRSLGERVALNVREAGLTVRMGAVSDADVVLVRVSASSAHPRAILDEYCRALKLPAPGEDSTPDALYQAEKRLIEGGWIVPLFHLPALHTLPARLRGWAPNGSVHWRLEDAWWEAAP